MSISFRKVLVLEDEVDLQEAMVTYLNLEGFVAKGVGSLRAAEAWMRSNPFDILVLDLGLPDGDGLAWLEANPELRTKGVIITTARGNDLQRIAGARAGADLYLVKPLQLEELSALTGNLARRLQPEAQRNWTLNPLHWTLESPEGKLIRLTHSETALLGRITASPGKAVSRQELIEGLGYDPESYDPRRMEILVRRLRGKSKAAFGYPLPLTTAHKCGYAFTAPIRLG